MRKIKIFLGIIVSSIILHACVELDGDNMLVGENFVVNPNTIFNVDTMTFNMSTIAKDSVITASPRRLLAGEVTDLVGVNTYCETYFQLDPAKSSALLESAVYDSAVFRIKLEGYHIGDTTKVANFGLFRVIEDMEFDEDETPVFYAHHQFKSEEEPWAVFEVDLSKSVNKQIDMPDKIAKHEVFEGTIKDEIGLELFNLVNNESLLLASNADFKEEYKGFVIKPIDADPNLVVGFVAIGDSTGAPEIEVYYHDNTDNDDLSLKYEYSYSIVQQGNLSPYSFNHIENDFSNSVFEEIMPGESKLNSNKTNNLTYINGGVDVETRFDLRNFDYLYTDKYTAVLNATLSFEPAEGTYNDFFDLPRTLDLDLLNNDNSVAGNITMIDGSTLARAYLKRDDEYNEYRYYCDITRYFKDIYDKTLEKRTSGLPVDIGSIMRGFSLKFSSNGIASGVDRLVLGDFKNPQKGIKLEIVFIAN